MMSERGIRIVQQLPQDLVAAPAALVPQPERGLLPNFERAGPPRKVLQERIRGRVGVERDRGEGLLGGLFPISLVLETADQRSQEIQAVAGADTGQPQEGEAAGVDGATGRQRADSADASPLDPEEDEELRRRLEGERRRQGLVSPDGKRALAFEAAASAARPVAALERVNRIEAAHLPWAVQNGLRVSDPDGAGRGRERADFGREAFGRDRPRRDVRV